MSTGAPTPSSLSKAGTWPYLAIAVLAGVGSLAIVGQVWNMRTTVKAARLLETAAAADTQREGASQEWQKLDEQIRRAITQEQEQLGKLKAETASAQAEQAVLAQKLGSVKKDAELGKSSLDELLAKQKLAQEEVQRAVAQKNAQEVKTRELSTEEKRLRDEIVRLMSERDQLAKAAIESAASSQKLSLEIASSQKLLTDVQKQVEALSTKQKDLQASGITASAETEAILADKSKVAQQRDSLLAEVTSLRTQTSGLKTEKEGLETEIQQLQGRTTKFKSEQLMQEKALATATSQAAEAAKTLQQKRDEITDLQQRIDVAKVTEQKLLGDLRRLSGILHDGGAATQPTLPDKKD